MTNLRVNRSSDRSRAVQVLHKIVGGLRRSLGDNLVGIYLYGSYVAGDFDARLSDLDLVVVLQRALDCRSFHSLQALHQAVIRSYPDWEDRLELAYISRAALSTFRERESRIAIISPGEPFHHIMAGRDWLISWYMLREIGIALSGPDIASLIDPISSADYIDAVQAHIETYRGEVETAASKSYLSYIILTTARGLYTVLQRQPTSKVKAAQWARESFPQWAPLIQLALSWRVDPNADKLELKKISPLARAYVEDMLARLPGD